MTSDPHRNQAVLAAGRKLSEAAGAVILIHGRGASAEDILSLGQEFDHPDLAYLAPQAAGHTWYPYSFLAPIEQNEPWLTSALDKIGKTVDEIVGCGYRAREDRDRRILARGVSGVGVCRKKCRAIWRPDCIERRIDRASWDVVPFFR